MVGENIFYGWLGSGKEWLFRDAVYRLTDFDRGQLNQNKDDRERGGSLQFGGGQTAISKGRKPRRDGLPKTGADEAEVGEGRSP